MNIVILTASLHSAGGTERTIAGLTDWLSKNTDDEITIVKFDRQESFYKLNSKISLVEPGIEFSHNKIRGSIQRLAFCERVLRAIEPSVIVTFYAKTSLYAAFSKRAKCKLVSSERYNPLKRNMADQILAKIASLFCDGFIFQTSGAQGCYPAQVRKKSIVIPNAINKMPPKDITSKKSKIVSAVGRLTRQKGFDILIRAFKDVWTKHPDWRLEIYGAGEDEKALQAQINLLGLENNAFLMGNKNDILNHLNKTEIFVLSSRDEGMPNALMEAMSCGLACVSTDCNFGPRDLIQNNTNGILVPVEDVRSLSEAINRLVENQSLRYRLAKAAKKINLTHSADIIYQKYYQYLTKRNV